MRKDFQQLRKIIDSGDSFVGGGHTIIKIRRRKRKIPEWTRNDSAVKKVLLRSFPKLRVDIRDRTRAARWLRIIYLYFRLQYTHRQISEELELTPTNIKRIIISIRRAGNERKANSGAARSLRGGGRPKAVSKLSVYP